MIKKVFFVLFILFLGHLAFRIYEYRGEYLSTYDVSYWTDIYLHSQWVIPESDITIGDDGLYAYAGWEYINGREPTTLNTEVPPLGKYLIGLSILLFGNQNFFGFFSGIFVLIAFFLFNKTIFRSPFLAFLPVFIFSFDPLFYTQLRAPFLDLLYLGFLFLTFLFFLKERFLFAAFFFGCMMATKNSVSTFVLVAVVQLLYLLYTQQRYKIKEWIVSLPVSIGVFLLSYAVFFLQGKTLGDFISVQRWIINFYAVGAKGHPLSGLEMLLTGIWSTWWGETRHLLEWSIIWPLSFIASLYYLYYTLKKRERDKTILCGIWIVVYLVFLLFVPVWPRYLLLVLPFMYNLTIGVINKYLNHIST